MKARSKPDLLSERSSPAESPSSGDIAQKTRKRKQVKLACTNCRRNHTACDRHVTAWCRVRICLLFASTRPCKRCVAANEPHLCTDAPKRSKAKRFGANRPNSSYGSDGAGSSGDEESDSESHSHSHSHSQQLAPPAPRRRQNLPPYTASRSSLIMAGRLADPEAAFNDETDYLSSLYLMELSRRAAIEAAATCV